MGKGCWTLEKKGESVKYCLRDREGGWAVQSPLEGRARSLLWRPVSMYCVVP